MGPRTLQNSSLSGELVKLGIIVALSEELKSLTDQKIESGSSFKLNDDALLSLSGAGPDRAAEAATQLVEQGVNALLSWGCAAGLTSELKPGSLLIPEQIQCENGILLPVDSDWHNRLIHFLSGKLQVQKGCLLESEQIISDPDEKKLLYEKSQAIAVDMESGAIAKVAKKNKSIFLAVKAIADTGDRRIPQSVLNSIDSRGQVRRRVLIKNALLHPFDWNALAQLGQQFKAAHKTLKQVAAISPNDFLCEEPCA